MKCLLGITVVLALIMLAIHIKNIVSNDCEGTAGVYIDCSSIDTKITYLDNELKLPHSS